MYNKILYALDLSSKPHLQKAIAIAKQLNAELFIGYTTFLGESYTDDDIYFGKLLGDEIVDKKKQQLHQEISTLIAGAELKNQHIYVVDGPVGKAIDALAQSLNVELILIAKSHRHFSFFIKDETLIRLNSHYDTLTFT